MIKDRKKINLKNFKKPKKDYTLINGAILHNKKNNSIKKKRLKIKKFK